jgi:hypothetical protein
MIPPSEAAARLGISCLLGLVLGLAYDFFHGQPHKHLGDLLFLPVLFWIWLFLGFFVCRGDLRPGYWTGLGLGFFLWRITLGRFFRPIFAGFWKILGLPLRLSKKFLQKIHIFIKNLFASGKKSSTMRKLKNTSQKGVRHGKVQRFSAKHQAGLQAQQQCDQNRGSVRHRHLHGGTSDSGRRHSGRSGKNRRASGAGIPSGAGK